MRLHQAASRFDTTLALDAYDRQRGFRCQLEPFDYVKIDGSAVKRRVMSTAPEVSLPVRHTINIGGQVYLVGEPSADHWGGSKIRNRYVLQGVDEYMQVRSFGQALAALPGRRAWAGHEFNKYSTDERDSDDYHVQCHLYFGSRERVPENALVSSATTTFLVRQSHLTMAGLLDVRANELDEPVEDTVSLSSSTYDPVTDTRTSTESTVRCIRLRWQENFAYLSLSSAKYERGDMQVLLPLGTDVDAGDTLGLSDGNWRVLAVQSQSDHLGAHVRRA